MLLQEFGPLHIGIGTENVSRSVTVTQPYSGPVGRTPRPCTMPTGQLLVSCQKHLGMW